MNSLQTLIESTLVSLDGVIGEPTVWATEYFDAQARRDGSQGSRVI